MTSSCTDAGSSRLCHAVALSYSRHYVVLVRGGYLILWLVRSNQVDIDLLLCVLGLQCTTAGIEKNWSAYLASYRYSRHGSHALSLIQRIKGLSGAPCTSLCRHCRACSTIIVSLPLYWELVCCFALETFYERVVHAILQGTESYQRTQVDIVQLNIGLNGMKSNRQKRKQLEKDVWKSFTYLCFSQTWSNQEIIF